MGCTDSRIIEEPGCENQATTRSESPNAGCCKRLPVKTRSQLVDLSDTSQDNVRTLWGPDAMENKSDSLRSSSPATSTSVTTQATVSAPQDPSRSPSPVQFRHEVVDIDTGVHNIEPTGPTANDRKPEETVTGKKDTLQLEVPSEATTPRQHRPAPPKMYYPGSAIVHMPDFSCMPSRDVYNRDDQHGRDKLPKPSSQTHLVQDEAPPTRRSIGGGGQVIHRITCFQPPQQQQQTADPEKQSELLSDRMRRRSVTPESPQYQKAATVRPSTRRSTSRGLASQRLKHQQAPGVTYTPDSNQPDVNKSRERSKSMRRDSASNGPAKHQHGPGVACTPAGNRQSTPAAPKRLSTQQDRRKSRETSTQSPSQPNATRNPGAPGFLCAPACNQPAPSKTTRAGTKHPSSEQGAVHDLASKLATAGRPSSPTEMVTSTESEVSLGTTELQFKLAFQAARRSIFNEDSAYFARPEPSGEGKEKKSSFCAHDEPRTRPTWCRHDHDRCRYTVV